ncbi:hypothetical protein J6590_042449 [Homalodisca vitripennis]|nr:hypothetical protein J6590_042449 [Homalodisca vitripennis]
MACVGCADECRAVCTFTSFKILAAFAKGKSVRRLTVSEDSIERLRETFTRSPQKPVQKASRAFTETLITTTLPFAVVTGSKACRLWCTDESTFHHSRHVNTHNVRILGSENPHEIVQLQRDSHPLNVMCAISRWKLDLIKQNKEESRYSTRSVVLIKYARVTDRTRTCTISNSDSKSYTAWLPLGWVTAERSCPCKQPACPSIGGGLEVTFKPLVSTPGDNSTTKTFRSDHIITEYAVEDLELRSPFEYLASVGDNSTTKTFRKYPASVGDNSTTKTLRSDHIITEYPIEDPELLSPFEYHSSCCRRQLYY